MVVRTVSSSSTRRIGIPAGSISDSATGSLVTGFLPELAGFSVHSMCAPDAGPDRADLRGRRVGLRGLGLRDPGPGCIVAMIFGVCSGANRVASRGSRDEAVGARSPRQPLSHTGPGA